MPKIIYNLMYVYDLTPTPREMHKIKRKFYYHMKKLDPFISKATKSVFLANKAHETQIDNFFFKFKGVVTVYKCEINSFTILK
jgi:hypothetical protein